MFECDWYVQCRIFWQNTNTFSDVTVSVCNSNNARKDNEYNFNFIGYFDLLKKDGCVTIRS